MRIGKTGGVRCDFCGEIIERAPDSLTRGGQVKHFCPTSCLDEYLHELCQEYIAKEVGRQVREEFNLIHRQVCPACKYRLTTKIDVPYDSDTCPSCGEKLVCLNCDVEE